MSLLFWPSIVFVAEGKPAGAEFKSLEVGPVLKGAGPYHTRDTAAGDCSRLHIRDYTQEQKAN